LHNNQSLAGSLHSFEDVGGGPDERFRALVVMIDIVFDGGDQFEHIAKHSTAWTVRGKVAKEVRTTQERYRKPPEEPQMR